MGIRNTIPPKEKLAQNLPFYTFDSIVKFPLLDTDAQFKEVFVRSFQLAFQFGNIFLCVNSWRNNSNYFRIIIAESGFRVLATNLSLLFKIIPYPLDLKSSFSCSFFFFFTRIYARARVLMRVCE